MKKLSTDLYGFTDNMHNRALVLEQSTPDDIRAAGWAVAVHNDYRLHGSTYTFWLFTKGNRCVKGEGPTDADALNQIRRDILAD